MPLAEGIKLGRFEIRAHIGAGGMGHVYLAQDTSELDRTVAIKIMPADVATDPKWMQRFIREARTVSGLNHPNVLTIYEFGVHDSTRFMAMEYVEGATLIPEIEAVIELRHNSAPAVLELLEKAGRYEAAAALSPQTLRGMIYLKLGQGAQAAAEARKILDHRGQGPLSTLWPLAHLTLARASAMQGDTAQARKSYQDFFTLWKDADPDIPILIEAKREF